MGLNATLKRLAGRVAPSRVLVRGSPRSGAVALTFDDGPHANTPAILDLLAREGVPATFFVQGTEVVKRPDLVRAIAEGGHALGNHGFRHLHWKAEPIAALLEDVATAQARIQEAAGRSVSRLYRPPFGEITPFAALRLWQLGYRIVFWSADSQDSFADSPAAILRHLASPTLCGGDIVLLHDDGAHTMAALPDLIARIRDAGLAIGTLDGLGAPRRE